MSVQAYVTRADLNQILRDFKNRIRALEATPEAGIPDAAFLTNVLNNLAPQALENLSAWTSLIIDPTFSINRDRLTDGGAVRLEDSDDAFGSRIVFENTEDLAPIDYQYWLVGGWISVGSLSGILNVFDNDTTLRNHQLALRIRNDPGNSGFLNKTSVTLIPAADGNYHFEEQESDAFHMYVSGLLDPSEVMTLGAVDPEDQNGLVLQAWHNIDWVDNVGDGKGPPAVRAGQIWGTRYTTGLFDA